MDRKASFSKVKFVPKGLPASLLCHPNCFSIAARVRLLHSTSDTCRLPTKAPPSHPTGGRRPLRRRPAAPLPGNLPLLFPLHDRAGLETSPHTEHSQHDEKPQRHSDICFICPLSRPCSERSQLPGCELSYGEAHTARNRGSSLANSHLAERGNSSALSRTLR